MKTSIKIFLTTAILFSAQLIFAQPVIRIVSANLQIGDNLVNFSTARYGKTIDSLSNAIKKAPKDTTALFYHSALIYRSNDILAKPSQDSPGAVSALVKAKDEAEKALQLNMKDQRLKVLRARILTTLCYQYSGDESWKFNAAQIKSRRALFNSYKQQANQAWDELSSNDPANAFDYGHAKVNYDYPIK